MTNDLHSLAAAYALNALDGDERAAFEAHLASCERCTTDVSEFSDIAATLVSSDAVTPPAHVRASVLARLDQVEQERPASVDTPATAPTDDVAPVVSLGERRRRFSVPNLLAAAAVVALLVVGAVVIAANRGGSDFDDVVAASDAVVTQLDGDRGTVDVAYSAEREQVAVRGTGFDDLGPGLRYALWAIAGGTPIPAGLFEADDGEIDEVAELVALDAEAWGITIEPAAGSDQPTTDIIYFAEV